MLTLSWYRGISLMNRSQMKVIKIWTYNLAQLETKWGYSCFQRSDNIIWMMHHLHKNNLFKYQFDMIYEALRTIFKG
jgi:hypothetical protein